MNKVNISLKKLNGIIISQPSFDDIQADNRQLVYSLNAEMMRLGFVLSHKLMDGLISLPKDKLEKLSKKIITCLKKLKGDDVRYNPMYPNFPQQVMDMSEIELYFNALMHYWSKGTWKPESVNLPREFELENTKFREIKLVSEDDFAGLFTILLNSNDSLSKEDTDIVQWFLSNYSDLKYPDSIPYKETLCIIAKDVLSKGGDIRPLIKTATDLLRVITHISDGDVSLTENTKFKSLPRRLRKQLVGILENVINEEDIQRHRNKWGKLFHNLHVGEYSEKVRRIANKVRSNKRLETTASRVQCAIDDDSPVTAAVLLKSRPGEFARRLDHLLRVPVLFGDATSILNHFCSIMDKISTRVLMQLKGHFQARDADANRVVFPKGSTQKAQLIPGCGIELDLDIVIALIDKIDDVLEKRFAGLKPLGKVWIDERLKKCPLPMQQRSSSNGLDIVARGTRLPIEGDKNTLRLFIYWIGQDIDLSATLHDEDFNMIEHIAYTNLKSHKYNACHSGDIVQAPKGASEFIDITMDKAFENGIRYVIMNVLVYAGPNFDEHKKCYAGWMTRSKPKSNEIYDPKTVMSKVDLASASKNVIPVIFDLKTKEAIWCDLVTKSNITWNGYLVGNNVEANKASIEQVLKAILSLDNKPTLHGLLSLHAKARGVVVEKRKEADIVFGLEGDVTPRDINIINSNYLV